MDRVLRLVIAVTALVAFCAPALFAGGLRGDRGQGARGGDMQKQGADRMQQMQPGRLLNAPLAVTDKGKAELQRFRTEVDPLFKSAAELRDKVKKEVEAGATLEDATKNHLDEAKDLAKKVLAAYATYLDNMAKLVKDEGANAVDKLGEALLKEMDRKQPGAGPGAGKQGDKKPQPPTGKAPAGGGDNPFND